MKKILLIFLLLPVTQTLMAQANKCYSDQAKAKYLQDNPAMSETYRQTETAVRNWITANKTRNGNRTSAVVTIPVVFHVVYKNATQNIADSNIFRQVAVLNECYRLQNANFSQTRPIFDTIAADIEVEFCLAARDPNGNPTNGIVRRAAGAGAAFDPLTGFDNVKSIATGGDDPWPCDQYLNVWVCDMSIFGLTFVLGYATFPGGDPTKDGVVIQYNFIGNYPNQTTNNAGRTTVHEVGHWLGLRHIWGDGQNSPALCDSTDYVDDTPNADSASQQTCVIKNTCSNESPYWTLAGIDPPDMIENYMDYSYDACMTMFTKGQKDRMLGFLNTTRATILSSPGCTPVGLAEHHHTDLISVYPNPGSGKFHLTMDAIGRYDLLISDLAGKTLRVFDVNSVHSNFDISDLPSGVYICQVKEGSQLIKSEKLIKIDRD